MEIRIEPHTLRQARRRGVVVEEIIDVLQTGKVIPAHEGRLAKYKVFDFRSVWMGRYYDQKRVEVVYVVEKCVMITVTVYGFYGRWEDAA